MRSSSPCQCCELRPAPIRDDDDARARSRRQIGRSDDRGGEAFHRGGLADVERLPLCHAAPVVDQANDAGGVPPCQRVRGQAAQLSGSDDGDLAHAVRYCNGGERANRDSRTVSALGALRLM